MPEDGLYIAETCSMTCLIKTRWDIVVNKGGLIFSLISKIWQISFRYSVLQIALLCIILYNTVVGNTSFFPQYSFDSLPANSFLPDVFHRLANSLFPCRSVVHEPSDSECYTPSS
jgi:hypothetical protein